MDAPCDSRRRVAGRVGWGKRFGVSGMGDDVVGSTHQADEPTAFALVPHGDPWNDPEVGSSPAPRGAAQDHANRRHQQVAVVGLIREVPRPTRGA